MDRYGLGVQRESTSTEAAPPRLRLIFKCHGCSSVHVLATHPEKGFKDILNLNHEPDLHKRLVVNVTEQGVIMNAFFKGIGILKLSNSVKAESYNICR